MPLPSSLVGAGPRPVHHTVGSRWLMAYAAGIADGSDVYFDTASGVVGHPLFPVCIEWPVVLAARAELLGDALTPDERRRGVHATHDLVVHRLVVAGDELTTTGTIERIEPRTPGAYEVVRLDTVDADGQPVATTRMGSIFLGVDVDGPARGEVVPGPAAPGDVTPGRVVSRSIRSHAAHLYTETARIYNPIHTDAEVARRAGLPGPILHGTATLAMAVSEVVRRAAAGDPHRVRRVAARFGAMVPMPSELAIRVSDEGSTRSGAPSIVPFDVLVGDDPAVRDGSVVVS